MNERPFCAVPQGYRGRVRNVQISCRFFMDVSELVKHMQKVATSGGFRGKCLVDKACSCGALSAKKSILWDVAPGAWVSVQAQATNTAVRARPSASHPTEVARAEFPSSEQTERMLR